MTIATNSTDATPTFVLSIEVYENFGPPYWAQARFLVHGYNDILWTNSMEDAIHCLSHNLLITNLLAEKYAIGRCLDVLEKKRPT